jgi:phage terminase large subunit GpA-like protein
MAKCPHCNKEVTLNSTKKDESPEELHKEVEGMIKKEVMYSCPHCECVLGFAFFLGGMATNRP